MLVLYDADLVDMTLGTGCKITPAPDHNEFESGRGHGLAFIDVYKQLVLIYSEEETQQLHLKHYAFDNALCYYPARIRDLI